MRPIEGARRTRTRRRLVREAARIRRTCRRGLAWVHARVPPGLRSVVGVLLVCGGVLGFLPVLGFWMIPLGLAVIWLDVRSLRDRLRGGAGRDG